jgi:DNA-binding GntR family transcriptional regulator
VHIPVVTKTEHVRREVIHQILSGELRPGDRILEAKLSKNLGVSQATVNAALQDLHNQAMVTKLANRSTNVRRYSLADIERLFAVRMLLEPAAVSCVSAAWSEEARDALQQQVDHMRRAAVARDLAKWGLADYMFHHELYRLAGNRYLARAAEAIAAAPFAYIFCDHLEALPTDYISMAEDHQAIVAGIEQGPVAAGQVIRQYIEQWLENSRRALEGATANPSLLRKGES